MFFSSWLRNLISSPSRDRRVSGTARKRTGFRPQLEALDDRLVPSTLTVTNNLDSGAGSLRAEIAAASPGDTVNFAPGLSHQTIKLTGGELVINKSLTIQGPGADQLAISGGNTSRVFEVDAPNANVFLSGLTITQGNGHGAHASGEGGGIANLNSSTLTVSGCTLSNNRASDYGGGIYNSGATLNIINSTISGNSVNNSSSGGGEGGGVYSVIGHSSITDCTLTHNTAGFEGGGIWIVSTTMTISGCTLTGNTARIDGGAIHNSASASLLTVTDSVFSANSPTKQPPISGQWTNGGGDTFQ
jgi:hypothetical protein